MPKGRKSEAKKTEAKAYVHDDASRANIPEAGMIDYAPKSAAKSKGYCWDPRESPQLVWAGKAGLKKVEVDEQISIEIPTVNLHIHERVSAEAILRSVQRKDAQRSLFADPDLEFQKEIQYYKHEVDWSNRMILGDSLLVMNSLVEREGMAGKVQCIYMDPPYGVNYKSNFQPKIDQRDVKDGKDEDLTREVMQVQAFRDTWELGVHSYLTYLRDRLLLSRELLSDSGSIFVQIGDENVHRMRCLMDEVFGEENFHALISFKSKSPLGQSGLAKVFDYIVWYSKQADQMKFRRVFASRQIDDDKEWRFVEATEAPGRFSKISDAEFAKLKDHSQVFRRYKLTSSGFTPSCIFNFQLQNKTCRPYSGKSWATNKQGMTRLIQANRLFILGESPYFQQKFVDYPVQKLENAWTDQPGATVREYVVETDPKFIKRCILMTTDPGDLVLDPTCGSGTTAFVAEQWGRRWIMMDTSRVALAIARHRLLTSSFDYYRLRHPTSGVNGGFVYETVPHVTLESVAQNTEIDTIAEEHEPHIELALAKLNVFRPDKQWHDWEVPSPDYDSESRDSGDNPEFFAALDTFWKFKREMQTKIDASIAKNAPTEELVDQPEKERNVVRVSGPFTMEAVPNVGAEFSMTVKEQVFDDALQIQLIEGAQTELTAVEARNVGAYLADMIQKLHKTGVVAKNGKKLSFETLQSVDHAVLHAVGRTQNGESKSIAIVFGPQNGSISESHVKDALHAAKKYDILLFCGYDFTPSAQEMAQAASSPDWQVLLAYIAPDTVMQDLLKDTKASQLFTMIGEPDVVIYLHGDPHLANLVADATGRGVDDVATRAAELNQGEMFLEVRGVDLYDPLSGEVKSDVGANVHAIFIDQDYDGKSFCICQALFPNKKDSWSKIAKNLKGSIDEEAFSAFRTLVSLPFKPGASFDKETGEGRVQIKVIDQRGNAVVKTIRT